MRESDESPLVRPLRVYAVAVMLYCAGVCVVSSRQRRLAFITLPATCTMRTLNDAMPSQLRSPDSTRLMHAAHPTPRVVHGIWKCMLLTAGPVAQVRTTSPAWAGPPRGAIARWEAMQSRTFNSTFRNRMHADSARPPHIQMPWQPCWALPAPP